ncbi:MAG: acetylglutamate kinase [Candidatus Rifleibacteriota bacterium]
MKKQKLLVKYGGNAMTDSEAEKVVVSELVKLYKSGHRVVVVHGGGPFIASLLKQAEVESKFVHGHRQTDKDAMNYVEMALSGQVNGRLVSQLNAAGAKAVGLSGKDALMAQIVKRYATEGNKEDGAKIDIGFVGDVTDINTELISLLLENNYLPVVSPVSMDNDGNSYNVNADMFAGHLAGALGVDHFSVLTDIDGLRQNVEDPSTRISSLDSAQAKDILPQIKGGMIPKIESCLIALQKGAGLSHIVQGNNPDSLAGMLSTDMKSGTTITA